MGCAAVRADGELRPTAERIAERAGVSERSVFQHFPDREALFEAVARQQYEQVVTGTVPVDASRPLAERIDEFALRRAAVLEQITPVRRAALLLEHESDVVAGWLTTARRGAATIGSCRGEELVLAAGQSIELSWDPLEPCHAR